MSKPYFAPPAEGAVPEGEVPAWGDDAKAIAREAGLGSYGADPSDQEAREDALITGLEHAEQEAFKDFTPRQRVEDDLAALKGLVSVLVVIVFALGVAVGWLVVRALR